MYRYTTSTLPQTRMGGVLFELRSKSSQMVSESLFGQRFSENVSWVLRSSDRLHIEFTLGSQVSEVVVSNVDVFDFMVILHVLG